ncbi:MAG: 39S ribosomal protein L45 [Alphaproteobacteria bacterium]|nr:39S ribosomal protein L45 [Alphaproteobacteria bacterium]
MEAAGIPTDIIIYAVIACVLVVWLGRVLGTRSGSERQRPNPFTLPPAGTQTQGTENVVKLPAPKTGSAGTDAGLVQIALADRSFDPNRFVENAKEAFAIVVGAFADGDRKTLQDLLSPEVYKSFDAAIKQREAAGKKVVTEVHAVRMADIIDAQLIGNKASVTLRFKADETYVETDKDGKTVAGHPDRVVTMTDVWVFARDVKSNDPRWFVVETRDDVKETEGRKLPESGINV